MQSLPFVNNTQGKIDYAQRTFTLTQQSDKTFCITREQAQQLFQQENFDNNDEVCKIKCGNRNRKNNNNENNARQKTSSYVDTFVLSNLTSCHVQILYPVKNILLRNLHNCVICVGPSRVCYIGLDCQSSVLHIASAYLYTADNLIRQLH